LELIRKRGKFMKRFHVFFLLRLYHIYIEENMWIPNEEKQVESIVQKDSKHFGE